MLETTGLVLSYAHMSMVRILFLAPLLFFILFLWFLLNRRN